VPTQIKASEIVLKVAITGGAGSGKSTVARMFRELGAVVVDADDLARQAVAVGTPVWQELRRTLGPEYFRADGELNRAQVAARVFADPEARRRLDALIHPQVAREIKARLTDLERRGTPLVLVEVPLLFEARLMGAYDKIIVVDVDEADQVQRLGDRDHRDAAEIAGILKAQLPLKDKVARADFVVDNRGSLSHTRVQVKNIWGKLQKILLTAAAKKVSVRN
jgi:dephospho-CoA kinase